MKQTHLMKDRHLDQILMCSVYVICKVGYGFKVQRRFEAPMRFLCEYIRSLLNGSFLRRMIVLTTMDQVAE